jgi:hypothetical protein
MRRRLLWTLTRLFHPLSSEGCGDKLIFESLLDHRNLTPVQAEVKLFPKARFPDR